MLGGTPVVKRLAFYFGVLGVVGVVTISYGLIYVSQQTYKNATLETTTEPFPIGVDPQTTTITEQAIVPEFYQQHLAQAQQANTGWLNRLASRLQSQAMFQQLASATSRIVVIWSGERTEEIANNIGAVLRWDPAQRAEFIARMETNEFGFTQGYAVPGQYITHRYATPEDIATVLNQAFTAEVDDRYSDDVQAVVPLSDALIIASLIEREASDFENMREISGVIWNRLFIDMPLQLDASLQYFKTADDTDTNFWPAVRPPDKFLDSPFNTYQNGGLPPAPIANPSVAAIVATLNPRVTDCLYYFHSRDREYFCSVTYEEHVRKLRAVYDLE